MNSELSYLQHPWKRRIAWIMFYLFLLAAIFVGSFKLANHINTHTLPVGYIKINSLHSKYLVGEPIKVQVQNNLSTTIYVGNQCPSEPLAIYREENEQWIRIHEDADINICKKQNRIIALPANSATIVDFSLWKKLFEKPGTYRVVAVVENYKGLPYQDFDVVAPPEVIVPQGPSSSSTTKTQPQPVPTPQPILQRPIRSDRERFNDD